MIEPTIVYGSTAVYWYLFVCFYWESVDTPELLKKTLRLYLCLRFSARLCPSIPFRI